MNLKKLIHKNENGFGLIEVVVSIAVMGAISAVFLTANSVAYKSLAIASRESISQRIAQVKMEAVKSPTTTAYDSTAPYSYEETDRTALESTGLDYPGYTVSVSVGTLPGSPADIQKITVTVKLNGNEIFTLVDYKVNR